MSDVIATIVRKKPADARQVYKLGKLPGLYFQSECRKSPFTGLSRAAIELCPKTSVTLASLPRYIRSPVARLNLEGDPMEIRVPYHTCGSGKPVPRIMITQNTRTMGQIIRVLRPFCGESTSVGPSPDKSRWCPQTTELRKV